MEVIGEKCFRLVGRKKERKKEQNMFASIEDRDDSEDIGEIG